MWLKDTDKFLPCSPLDYQEFLPLTDFPLDDFIQMDDFGDEKLYLTGECTTVINECYTDLMDITKHEKQQCSDMTNLSNEDKTIEKDKEYFPTINCSILNSTCLDNYLQSIDSNDDIASSSENALPLSSSSRVFTSAILDTSKDETFCDLKMFLEEKECVAFPSIDTNTSKENYILKDADTSTSRSPLDNGTCFSTISSPSEQSEHISLTLEDSDVDSDEDLEPKKKAPKLNSNCKGQCKNTKYVEMRRKNNVASRRSRQTKKQKEKEMEEKATTLEKENESLRIKEKKLQELVDKLKQMLFSSVNKNK